MIKLVPFLQIEMPMAFTLYKQELEAVITNSLGWNEQFQLERFEKSYKLECLYWIKSNQSNFGFISYTKSINDIHVSLLILDTQFQNKKIGTLVMQLIENEAMQSGLKITLSSFKNNLTAIRFYKKRGYTITKEEDHFYDFELKF